MLNVAAIMGRLTADPELRHTQNDIAVTGSIQTRNYEDRQGNKRKAFEIVASDVSFTGSKRESGSAGGSSYESAPAPRPAAFSEPAPAYSSGSSEDFEEILGDDDLPF